MKFNGLRELVFGTALLTLANVGFTADYADAFEAATAEDYHKAASIWQNLAEEGNPFAQFNLALVYHSGIAGNLNEKEALKWYHKAAENGHYQAQEYLVVGYREGWFGLDKNPSKADFWEKKLNP